jgi:hypothetical protein
VAGFYDIAPQAAAGTSSDGDKTIEHSIKAGVLAAIA